MSNMSLYNDDDDNEIGPAPAGPAESAHNMTLQLNHCIFHYFFTIFCIHKIF